MDKEEGEGESSSASSSSSSSSSSSAEEESTDGYDTDSSGTWSCNTCGIPEPGELEDSDSMTSLSEEDMYKSESKDPK